MEAFQVIKKFADEGYSENEWRLSLFLIKGIVNQKN
jgi:hypothetical protein